VLSADLLRTRVRGDHITPIFVEPDGDSLSLAEDIIRAFTDHTGGKLGELYDILEEMEDQGFDYRLVRGLVALVERRCALKVESLASPEMVRREAFMAAGGPVLTDDERQKAISRVATRLGLSPEEVESSMFADLESELVIGELCPPKPLELLKEYNLSQAQAMLFKATGLSFRASAKHKGVLRAVKRLGLMYSASRDGDRLDITIDGPMSVIKSTERYGTSLARLLPFIVASPEWRIEASIARKDFGGNPRLYRFIMEERTHGHLFGPEFNETVEFDSEPEDRFYESFRNAGTGWQITREPEPLIAGRYLYIPDFLLEREGTKVYVEIAGFWTAEYLKRKVAKLSELKDVNLIVLASTRESCDAFKKVTENVILFDRKIPLKEVLDRLKAWDEIKIAEGVSKLESVGLKLNGDIVRLEDVAARAGVGVDSVKRYAERREIPGYRLAGDDLLSTGVIDALERLMPATMRYSEACGLIRSKGIRSADPVLKMLGYTVQWSGLDPENAMVYKKSEPTGSSSPKT
jgi:predicted nuclease of restriction endonuclease-like RecB superfamily